jgi:chemotaxis response regulator CheB
VASQARVHAPLTVALLGRADGAREQLRRSLEDLGAAVVFEGDPAEASPERILQGSPQVVIVNLGSGVEDDIDHLQDVFDSPDVNVVFNEGDVTSQLAGWDLARWARHLAAKVMGHERTIPPPPPGSEPLPMRNFMPVPGAPPTPVQLAQERAIEEFMIEAEDRVDDVPSNHLPLARNDAPPAVVEDDLDVGFSLDLDEVEDALSQVHTPAPVQSSVPEREEPEIVVLEGDAAEFDVGLDLSALDAALQIDKRPPPEAKKSDAALLDEVLAGFDLGPSNAASSSDDYIDPSDLDDADFSVAVSSVSLDSDGNEDFSLDIGGDDLDDDVAALAAQLDALDAGTQRGEVTDLTFLDFSDEPEAATPAPAARPAPPPSQPAPVAANVQAPPAPRAAPAAEPAAKKFSLDDLALAPLDDGVGGTAAFVKSKDFDFSNIGLSLEPTQEELDAQAAAKANELPPLPKPAMAARPAPAPAPLQPTAMEYESEIEPDPIVDAALDADMDFGLPEADSPLSSDDPLDALFAAMDLSPSSSASSRAQPSAPVGIPRVIVLGASIGGPDAIRTFLGSIPADFPALFVLVQHLENGFFERLAQQLQKSSKLPVRVPDGVQRARAGEVLVVPANQRVSIEMDGAIGFTPHRDTPKYTPCIDDVLRDTADRFGANATAIIFSGMAGDAIEGAVYLTTLGGEVWAQDPASCVVSSMVDGARARGVVEFLGSPRDLAEHCVAKYGA